MKKQSLFLVLVLINVPAFGQEQSSVPHEPIQQTQVFDPLFNDPELDRFLNPNESEEEYVYSIEQPPPPGRLLIWLRIIGVPIINAFFSARRAVRESLAWILAKIKNDKLDAQAHAQN
ncbi:hypothetical protein BH09DEP1_BH09DEP1_7170 [soil metagenome]